MENFRSKAGRIRHINARHRGLQMNSPRSEEANHFSDISSYLSPNSTHIFSPTRNLDVLNFGAAVKMTSMAILMILLVIVPTFFRPHATQMSPTSALPVTVKMTSPSMAISTILLLLLHSHHRATMTWLQHLWNIILISMLRMNGNTFSHT